MTEVSVRGKKLKSVDSSSKNSRTTDQFIREPDVAKRYSIQRDVSLISKNAMQLKK